MNTVDCTSSVCVFNSKLGDYYMNMYHIEEHGFPLRHIYNIIPHSHCRGYVLWLKVLIGSGTAFRDATHLLIYLFIWGFMSLSTLYRSYHDG